MHLRKLINAVISYKSYTKEEKADVSEKDNAVISYTSYIKEEKADVSEKANAVISYTIGLGVIALFHYCFFNLNI